MAATLEAQVKEAITLGKKNAEAVQGLTKSLDSLVKKLSSTRADGHDPDNFLGGVPNVRTGENPLTSRGLMWMKMLGLISGQVDPEQAKVERDISARLYASMCKDPAAGYKSIGLGQWGVPGGRMMMPLSTSFMLSDDIDHGFRREIKALTAAGCDGADLDHMRWIRMKQAKSLGYGAKTLSWLNEFLGGSLVAPAEQGEIIELLRNKEALINAGARTVPLPPQGRLKYPRQTAASTTFWVGENAPIPDSNIGTGEIVLQAKKLCVMIKSPNELLRFASPAAEALMRDDMTKSLALALDLACLEGPGGDNQPLGIILRQDINRITSSDARANGDAITGRDIYRMVAAVEESNAEFGGYIMRPKTLYKYYQLRSDAVGQGDGQGPFLFNLIREPGEGVKATLAGFPVTKSTQVSQSRSKGTSTNLTYILGGDFSECLIGMFGAMEFAASTQGDTPFRYDQTWVRGIMSADFNIRHEAAIVLMDNLDVTI